MTERKLPEKRAELREMFAHLNYVESKFWQVCPYTAATLKTPNRKMEMNVWRQVGMCYYIACGNTSAYSGAEFGRDHSTVLHAIDVVLDYYHSSDPLVHEVLDELRNSPGEIAPMINYQTVPIKLEAAMAKLHPYIFDPSQFYCQQEKISRMMGTSVNRCAKQCNGCGI